MGTDRASPMGLFFKLLLLAALAAPMGAYGADAGKKTVCTITVNSPDEKEMFRRNLPRRQIPVRRTGRARTSRLAGFGVPRRGAL